MQPFEPHRAPPKPGGLAPPRPSEHIRRPSIDITKYYPPMPRISIESRRDESWKSKLRRPHPFLSREPGSDTTSNISDQSTASSRTLVNNSRSAKSRPVLKSMLLAPRKWLLYTIGLLALLVFALGCTYASRVEWPDFENTTKTSVNGTFNGTAIFKNGTIAPLTSQTTTSAVFLRLFARGLPTQNVSNSSVAVVFDPSDFMTPSNLVALGFYIATLPALTFFHCIVELLIIFIAARFGSKSSQHSNDFDDDEFDDADADLEKTMHKVAYPPLPYGPTNNYSSRNQTQANRVDRMKPKFAVFSIVSSLLIVAGWIIINAIQTHCEVKPSGNQRMCPIQVQASAALRVDKYSVIRLTFAWLLVLLYFVQIAVIISQSKLLTGNAPRPASTLNSPKFNYSPTSILKRGSEALSKVHRKSVRFSPAIKHSSPVPTPPHLDIPKPDSPTLAQVHYIQMPVNPDSPASDAGLKTPWQWQGQFNSPINPRGGDLGNGASFNFGFNSIKNQLGPWGLPKPDGHRRSLILPKLQLPTVNVESSPRSSLQNERKPSKLRESMVARPSFQDDVRPASTTSIKPPAVPNKDTPTQVFPHSAIVPSTNYGSSDSPTTANRASLRISNLGKRLSKFRDEMLARYPIPAEPESQPSARPRNTRFYSQYAMSIGPSAAETFAKKYGRSPL